MAIYNITTQADLENLPALASTDTVKLLNDVAFDANWTPMGSFAGTFDGNDKKLTGMVTRARTPITATQSVNDVTFTSTNFGTTHTIFFRAAVTGTGTFSVIGNYGPSTFNGVVWNSTTIWYYAGGNFVSWTRARGASFDEYAIVRTNTSVILYHNNSNRGARTLPANAALTLANFVKTVTGTWSCSLSNVIITSDAKSAAEVTRRYNSGLGMFNTTSNLTNIVSAWNMTEGSGTTIADAVGGLTGSSVDGWTTEVSKGGFIDFIQSATIKNVTIVSPSFTWDLVNNNTTTHALGGLVGSMALGTITGCAVTGGTISAPNIDFVNIGGLVGWTVNGVTISNCSSSVATFGWKNAGVQTYPSVCGMVGKAQNLTMTNCYFSGGGTTAPMAGICRYDSGIVRNCFSTGDVVYRELAVTGNVAPPTGWNTNYYYDRSKDGDGFTSHVANAVATLTDFYNITQAPMTSWDFTPTGYWSKSQDTVTYPPFPTDFSGDISGTVTGYSSGKAMKLSIPDKVYMVRDAQTGTGYGKFATPPTIGTVHTFIFTLEAIGSMSVIRKISTGDTGLFVLNGNQWKFGAGTGSPLSINIAPANAFVSGTHRYILTRNGTTLKFYVDGNLIQTTPYTNTNVTLLNAMEGIMQGGGGGGYCNGYLRSFIITTDEKDQAFVTADWNGGLIKRYDSSLSNLLLGYNFTEGIGNVIQDFSTNNNDLTYQSQPEWKETTYEQTYTVYSTTTTGSGNFSFTSVTGDHGRPLVAYIGGEAVKGSVVSTLTDGLMGNVTGVAIEQGTVSIGDVAMNPGMTYALISLASTQDTDQSFRTASNIIYYNNGVDALIPTGCTYTGNILPDTSETGDIVVDGTAALSGTVNGLDVSGTLTFNTGTINGDITNSGTFTANFVQLQVYSPTITNTGTMTLRAIFKDDTDFFGDITFTSPYFATAGKTYTFEHGKTYFYDSLTINGEVGNEITIQSDSAGNRFTLDGNGASLFAVDVKDCEADTADIFVTRGINSGGNDNREATPHLVFLAYQQAFVTELATA